MKNKINLIYKIIIRILVIGLVVASFFPIFQVNNAASGTPETYGHCDFTKNEVLPTKTKFGLSTIIANIGNLEDIFTIVEYDELVYMAKKESETEEYQQYLSEFKNSLKEEDIERIKEKMKDPTFKQGLGIVYSTGDFISKSFDEIDKNAGGNFLFSIISTLVFIAMIVYFLLVLPIIYFVKTIITLCGFKNIKLDDNNILKKNLKLYGCGLFVLPIFISMGLLSIFNMYCVELGVGAFIILGVTLFVGILTCVYEIINEQDKRAIISKTIKKTLTLASIIFVTVVLINFLSINLFGTFELNVDTFKYEYQIANELKSDSDKLELITKLPSTLLGMISILIIITLTISIRFLHNRLLYGKFSEDSSKEINRFKIIPLVAVALICIIVPLFMSSNNIEDRSKKYEEGKFTFIFDEYKIEESLMHELSIQAENAYEFTVEAHEEALKEYKDASEDEKEVIENAIEKTEYLKETAKIYLKMVRPNQNMNFTLCIVFALLTIGGEVVLIIVNNKVSKNEPKTETV